RWPRDWSSDVCSSDLIAPARMGGDHHVAGPSRDRVIDDPQTLPATYARVINHAIAGRPSDMVITTHSCRGNFRSTWISEGGYERSEERRVGREMRCRM